MLGARRSSSPLRQRIRALLDPATRAGEQSVARGRLVLAVFLLATVPLGTLTLQSTVASDSESSKGASWTYEALDEALNPLIVNRIQELHIAGAAVTVVSGDKILYSKGFGRAEVFGNRGVDPARTIFRIGSVSKVVTGVAVMQLVDRGLLDLDADVNTYLKEFHVEDAFDEPVRVRHLLTHTAGFDQLGLGRHVMSAPEKRPLGDFLAENLVRIRRPGEVSCYDTYAITLAGHLVELVSGLSFEDYLLKNVFAPLDMHRSGITVPRALAEDVAVGYEFAGEWSPQRWEFMNTDPASTINAPVSEMGNLMNMLLQGGTFQGRRVLSEGSVRAMLTRQYGNHPDLPGFGLTFWEDRSFGVDAFSHGGSMTGYSSLLYLVPDRKLGVFVAYNQESGRLSGNIVRTIVETLFGSSSPPTEVRPDWKQPVDLARFTGSYASNMYNHSQSDRGGWRMRPFDLSTDDEGRLLFQDRPCRPVGELLFQRDDGLLVAFRQNDQKEITHMFVQQTVFERLGGLSDGSDG